MIGFIILAVITLGSAMAAMTLRNLVHCGLALALAFAGLAGVYLQLSAEFVGFAQILVYVGAVAILIVFTILLTRNADVRMSRGSRGWAVGIVIAFAVAGAIALPILNSPSLNRAAAAVPAHSVKRIGEELMTTYIVPLQAIGLLLTAALLGGIVIAMRDDGPDAPKPKADVTRRSPVASAPQETPRFDASAIETKS